MLDIEGPISAQALLGKLTLGNNTVVLKAAESCEVPKGGMVEG